MHYAKTVNGGIESSGERRREPRFMTNGTGRVTVLDEAIFAEYSAVVIDVSRSGLQLELDTPLQTNLQIRVEFNGLTVIATVANLRSHGVRRYRVGVSVNCVAQSRYEAAIVHGLQVLNEA